MSLVNKIVLHIAKKGKRHYDSNNPANYQEIREKEIAQVGNIGVSKKVTFDNITLNQFPFQLIEKKGNQKDTIVYYIHGGGFVTGSPNSRKMFTSYLTDKISYNVYAIDYSLAPEKPFPNGLNDCVNGYLELIKLYDSNNIILIGESAGGNLVLSLLLKIKELKLPYPKMAFSLSPCVQFDKVLDSYINNVKTEGMVDNLSEEVLDIYLSKDSSLLTNPLVAPLYGDFSGVCPVYLFVSSSEVLYDDSVLMHNKLKECGVKTELFIRKGMVHTWIVIPASPEAKKDLNKISKIIEEAFNQ